MAFGQSQHYTWPVANPSATMLNDLSVVTQSTKIALDSKGTVVYHARYGSGKIDTWTYVLTLLRISAKAITSADPAKVLINSKEELWDCANCLSLANNICKKNVPPANKDVYCQIATSISS